MKHSQLTQALSGLSGDTQVMILLNGGTLVPASFRIENLGDAVNPPQLVFFVETLGDAKGPQENYAFPGSQEAAAASDQGKGPSVTASQPTVIVGEKEGRPEPGINERPKEELKDLEDAGVRTGPDTLTGAHSGNPQSAAGTVGTSSATTAKPTTSSSTDPSKTVGESDIGTDLDDFSDLDKDDDKSAQQISEAQQGATVSADGKSASIDGTKPSKK